MAKKGIELNFSEFFKINREPRQPDFRLGFIDRDQLLILANSLEKSG
jgi:hypothetical protein